jgi:hypothetical protein
MQTIEQMISSNPNRSKATTGLADCIAACIECAQSCVACADACLGEKQVEDMRRCIRLNQDCADICAATARVLSRLSEPDAGVVRAQLEVCALSCATCGTECHRHGDHFEHCKVCANICRRCEEACRKLLRTVGGASH